MHCTAAMGKFTGNENEKSGEFQTVQVTQELRKTTAKNEKFVCRGFINNKGTCYLGTALQCILAMKATRNAFKPVLNSDYSVPDSASFTKLVRSLFLERRIRRKPRKFFLSQSQSSEEPLHIVNLLHNKYPLVCSPLGQGGGDPDYVLCHILEELMAEGCLLKDLHESLGRGLEYGVTCCGCGILLSTYSFPGFMTDVKLDKEETLLKILQVEGKYTDGSSRLFTVNDILNLTIEILNLTSEAGSCNCNGTEFGTETVITSLPNTLIVNVKWVCVKDRLVLEQIIDIGEHMGQPNNIYKLVAVTSIMVDKKDSNIVHCIAYITSSKYDSDPLGRRWNCRNWWYKIDNDVVELVSFSEVMKNSYSGYNTSYNTLIYEKCSNHRFWLSLFPRPK